MAALKLPPLSSKLKSIKETRARVETMITGNYPPHKDDDDYACMKRYLSNHDS